MKNYHQIFNKAVLGVALVSGLAGCGVQYSDGDRVGTVTKISHKGILDSCKSWEGQLATDNFVRTKNGTSNTFSFSVTDPEIVKQIQAAQDSGDRVKLHYNQVMMPTNLCISDTTYYITSVQSVAKAQQAPKL